MTESKTHAKETNAADSRDARIDDIALFFSNNRKIVGVWVPHSVYTSSSRMLGDAEAWHDTIFTRARKAKGEKPYFVANLANLEAPGEPPSPEELEMEQRAHAASKPKAALVVEAGDLVIVPFEDPSHAYLVKKKEYEDQKICPPISPRTGSDLNFLALTQGAVLANIPKQDLAGMTCYLLNLSALAGT